MFTLIGKCGSQTLSPVPQLGRRRGYRYRRSLNHSLYPMKLMAGFLSRRHLHPPRPLPRGERHLRHNHSLRLYLPMIGNLDHHSKLYLPLRLGLSANLKKSSQDQEPFHLRLSHHARPHDLHHPHLSVPSLPLMHMSL